MTSIYTIIIIKELKGASHIDRIFISLIVGIEWNKKNMENQEGRRKKITILWQHSPRVHQHARYAKTKMDASERVYSASLYLEELRYQPLIPLRERRVTALFTTRATRPAPSSLALLPSCVSSSSSSSSSSRFLFPWPSSPSLTGCLIRRTIARVRIDPPFVLSCMFLPLASFVNTYHIEEADVWGNRLMSGNTVPSIRARRFSLRIRKLDILLFSHETLIDVSSILLFYEIRYIFVICYIWA